jgi:hypothetical protein
LVFDGGIVLSDGGPLTDCERYNGEYGWTGL